MAGDWIKMTHALPEKPEVLAISRRTGLNRFDVVGRLFMLWRWFDTNTVDGNAVGVTSVTLNECLFGYGDVTGFVTAVVSENWLDESEHGLSVVKFDEHISESAKKRAQTAKRVDKHKKKASANATTNDEVTRIALPDALPREDKEKDISSSLRSEEEAPSRSAVAALPTTPVPDFLGDENESQIPTRAVVKLGNAWELPEAWGLDAEKLGWQPESIVKEAEKFRQHWVSGKGAGTRRSLRGWRQAWSNWLNNAEKFRRAA